MEEQQRVPMEEEEHEEEQEREHQQNPEVAEYGIAYDLRRSTIADVVRAYDANNNIHNRDPRWYNQQHTPYYSALTGRLRQMGYTAHQQSLWTKQCTVQIALLEAHALSFFPELFWLNIPNTVHSLSVVKVEAATVYGNRRE